MFAEILDLLNAQIDNESAINESSDKYNVLKDYFNDILIKDPRFVDIATEYHRNKHMISLNEKRKKLIEDIIKNQKMTFNENYLNSNSFVEFFSNQFSAFTDIIDIIKKEQLTEIDELIYLNQNFIMHDKWKFIVIMYFAYHIKDQSDYMKIKKYIDDFKLF